MIQVEIRFEITTVTNLLILITDIADSDEISEDLREYIKGQTVAILEADPDLKAFFTTANLKRVK